MNTAMISAALFDQIYNVVCQLEMLKYQGRIQDLIRGDQIVTGLNCQW